MRLESLNDTVGHSSDSAAEESDTLVDGKPSYADNFRGAQVVSYEISLNRNGNETLWDKAHIKRV